MSHPNTHYGNQTVADPEARRGDHMSMEEWLERRKKGVKNGDGGELGRQRADSIVSSGSDAAGGSSASGSKKVKKKLDYSCANLEAQLKQLMKISLAAGLSNLNKRRIPGCFEVLGFDFMVDVDFRAWLIEINTNP